MKLIVGSLASFALFSGLSLPADPSLRILAERSFVAGEWQASADAWRRLLEAHPQDAFGKMRLGASLHMLGENLQAMEILEEAKLPGELLLPEALAWKAAAESAEELVDVAIESLVAAADLGWWDGVMINDSKSLRPLLRNPKLVSLRTKAEARADEAMDQFDPFVGRWRMIHERRDAAGNWQEIARGERIIERRSQGRVIVDELSSGGNHLAGWHPGTCSWRLYRCGTGESSGKVTPWIGRFEKAEARFLPAEVEVGKEQACILLRAEGEENFVEEFYLRTGNRERLVERRRHERLQ